MKVHREEWLQALMSVQAGLAPREIQEQSTCFVFKDGMVYTYNGEVMCSAKSKLDKKIKGAVKAIPLLNTLQKLVEEEVDVAQTEAELVISGKRKQAGITMENEILLLTEEVEKPAKWTKLHEDFSDAIGLVKESACNDASENTLTCIHIHPKWIEACDRYQITRYKMPTGVTEKTLVRKESIKHIVGLGMTEFCETKSWLHFRSGTGVVISCRRFVEEYPPLAEYLKVEGTETALPKGIQEAVDRAEIFSKENADCNQVEVNLTKGLMVLRGLGISGWYSEKKKINYEGKDLKFLINPKILVETAKRSNTCIISEDKIKVEGGRWKYVTVLSKPSDNGHSESTEEVSND